MSSNTRQITAAEWESHKEKILELRRSGISLEGDKGIIAKMTDDCSFTASPSQYASQLNKWGQRKYLTVNDWRLVLQIADQYDEQGIRYQILKNKQSIPAKELKRKRTELCSGEEYARYRQFTSSSDLLPEFIEFKTFNTHNSLPETVIVDHNDQSSASTSGNPTTTMNTSVSIMKTPDVGVMSDAMVGNTSNSSSQTPRHRPMSYGQETVLRAESAPAEEVHGFGHSFLDNPSPGAPFSDGNFSFETNEPWLSFETFGEAQAPYHEAENSHSSAFPSTIPDPAARNGSLLNSPKASVNASLDNGWMWNPSSSFDASTEDQGNPSNDIQQGRPTEQSTIDRQSEFIAHGNRVQPGNNSSAQILRHTQSLLSRQGSPSKPYETLLRTDMVKSSLMSLLPPDVFLSETLLSTRTVTQREIFGSSFYRMLVYSIENNFAGLEEVQIGLVLDFLKRDGQMRSRMTKYIKATPKKVTKALAEALIRAAIENSDAHDVAQQLCVGSLKPDEIVCTVDGRRYTAVERSAKLRSIEVTEVLLLAGADPNKTYAEGQNDDRGALELAVRSWGLMSRDNVVDIRLVKLLIKRNAKVSVRLVEAAIRYRDADLIRLIMSKVDPLEHSSYFASPCVMVIVIENLDSELATLLIKQIFEACTHTHCGKCPKEHCRIMKRMVEFAAMRGFSSLVKFLAKRSIEKHLPLACAVRGGREDIIEFMLEEGANVDAAGSCIDAPGSCIDDYNEFYSFITTPLAEAIRARKTELIQDLENRGALVQIQEGSRFKAALFAASEVGNLDYILKIFQMVTDIDVSTLKPALQVSIPNGHTNIALFLLKAGANVNTYLSKSSASSPFLKALRRRNRTLVEKMMECDLNMSASSQPVTSYLEEAARWGDLSIIKDLLSMSTGYSIETAITAAVEVANKPLIDFLVKDHGVSLNLFSDWGRPPLMAAITNKDVHMLQYLLELGADPSHAFDSSANTSEDRDVLNIMLDAFQTRYPAGKKGFGAVALQSALDQEDFELLDLLLKANFDTNAIAFTEKYGQNSALGMAMTKYGGSELDIIRRLISAGGSVNGIVAGSEHWTSRTVWPQHTALLQAIRQKSKTLVELLIEKGADIHRAARLGLKRTPLQYACEVGSIEIVELLLAKGAQVDEKPAVRGGATSLQLCAIKGYCGIAYKLLENGANIHEAAGEYNGPTAFDGAATNGRLHMLMLLWDASMCQPFSMEQLERAKKLAADNGHIACHDFLQELHFVRQGLIMPDPFTF